MLSGQHNTQPIRRKTTHKKAKRRYRTEYLGESKLMDSTCKEAKELKLEDSGTTSRVEKPVEYKSIDIEEYRVQDDLVNAIICPLSDPRPSYLTLVLNSPEDFHKVELAKNEGTKGMSELGFIEVDGDATYTDLVFSEKTGSLFVKLFMRNWMKILSLDFDQNCHHEVVFLQESWSMRSSGSMVVSEGGEFLADLCKGCIDVYKINSKDSVDLFRTLELEVFGIASFVGGMILCEIPDSGQKVKKLILVDFLNLERRGAKAEEGEQLQEGDGGLNIGQGAQKKENIRNESSDLDYQILSEIVVMKNAHPEIHSSISVDTKFRHICYAVIRKRDKKAEIVLIKFYKRTKKMTILARLGNFGAFSTPLAEISVEFYPGNSSTPPLIFALIRDSENLCKLFGIKYDQNGLQLFDNEDRLLFTTRCWSGLKKIGDSVICYSYGTLKRIVML